MTSSDSPREECGVVAIAAPGQDVARLSFFSLFALQHRGQEAAGIAVFGKHGAQVHKGPGLVNQVFSTADLEPLVGDLAIGHNRYSTTGSNHMRNVQPYLYETAHGVLGVAHNGNLVNAGELRDELLEHGAGLSSSSDTEVMALTLARAPGSTWEDRLAHAMQSWVGAYSLVVLTTDRVIAARDAMGFRPLSVGRLPDGGFMVASETGALRTVGAVDIREVEPGEIVSLTGNRLHSRMGLEPAEMSARCTFEHIYFSRPDAVWDGLSVHEVRQRLGEQLAKESPVEADVVVPVPDSSMPAAIGYARASGIAYNEGFTKNRYIGRTFIEPTDSLRKQGVAMKFMTLNENIVGKRVVMIDDSIVRGTTSGPLVRLMRDAGALEVHVRITCPPIAHPCHMGVSMGTYDELIAHRLNVEGLREHIGADSLSFLSLDSMMNAIGRDTGYCNACFTGEYPIEVRAASSKTGFEGVLS